MMAKPDGKFRLTDDNGITRHAVFKLVETRSVETGLLWGLGYANVSLTHSDVDTLFVISLTAQSEPDGILK